MLPHQQRVVDEKKELDERRQNLADFIQAFDQPNSIFASLPEPERARLYAQQRAMQEYSAILAERIMYF